MGRPSKPPTRAELIKRIRGLEAKLSHVHDDRQSTESSVRHASDQVAYWRCRQALASMDMWKAKPEDRRALDIESRKATEMAAEWERRKGEALKIGQEQDKTERLARIEAKIDEQKRTASDLRDIRT